MQHRPVRCRIPDILRERKIEPIEFYEALGWSKQKYWTIVNMVYIMSMPTARPVALYFGLPIDDLYEWPLDVWDVGVKPE